MNCQPIHSKVQRLTRLFRIPAKHYRTLARILRQAGMWLPGGMNALHTANSDKAYAAGLTFRPIAETVRATLPPDADRRAGLARERDRELLERWHG